MQYVPDIHSNPCHPQSNIWEREKEREKGRQSERDREREIESERERERQSERERVRERERQRDRERVGQREWERLKWDEVYYNHNKWLATIEDYTITETTIKMTSNLFRTDLTLMMPLDDIPSGVSHGWVRIHPGNKTESWSQRKV